MRPTVIATTFATKPKTTPRNTLIVNEDITIKSVPKQQDIFGVFKIDICSGVQVGIEAVEREKETEGEVRNILMDVKEQKNLIL